MRDNLIFTKIPEAEGESNEQTEAALRKFMTEKLGMSKERIKLIGFERVHRMGDKRHRPRNVIAKFSRYKDREEVRKNAKSLKGTEHYVFQQFPPEV